MENILNKKLHIKSGLILVVLNSPEGYLARLKPLPQKAAISEKIIKNCDFIQYFVSSVADLEKALPVCRNSIKDGGSIWITYPKKSSKIKTDLNRDISFPVLKKNGFTGVAIVSIDETWSAFRIKPVPLTGTKNSVSVSPDNFRKYVNKEKRIITPPEDLQKEFHKNKKAFELFNSLAFSHKKEYVLWILEAKRDDTRAKRIKGTIELLLKGSKNPFN
ncbi:MAG: YdeI/OmpD-associated family protein [Ignavibacteriaceae bacterium]